MDLRAMGRRLVALRIQMAGLVVTYFILHPSILLVSACADHFTSDPGADLAELNGGRREARP